MGFSFQLEDPKIVKDLYHTHSFAGGCLIKNPRGEIFNLGKASGVDWTPDAYFPIHPRDMFLIMIRIFGEPNQPCIDDYKMTFNYIFKSRELKRFYYEIYDYKNYLSCGVGRPNDFYVRADRKTVDAVNNELRELISELTTAYNLMRPE
jgi:hypothetical protein